MTGYLPHNKCTCISLSPIFHGHWLPYTLNVISQAVLILPEQPNSAHPGAVQRVLPWAATCLIVVCYIQETHNN